MPEPGEPTISGETPPWLRAQEEEREALDAIERRGVPLVLDDLIKKIQVAAQDPGQKEKDKEKDWKDRKASERKGALEEALQQIRLIRSLVVNHEKAAVTLQFKADRLEQKNLILQERVQADTLELGMLALQKKTGAEWESLVIGHSFIKDFYSNEGKSEAEKWKSVSCLIPEVAGRDMTSEEFAFLFLQDFSMRLFWVYRLKKDPKQTLEQAEQLKGDLLALVIKVDQEVLQNVLKLKPGDVLREGFLANFKGILGLIDKDDKVEPAR